MAIKIKKIKDETNLSIRMPHKEPFLIEIPNGQTKIKSKKKIAKFIKKIRELLKKSIHLNQGQAQLNELSFFIPQKKEKAAPEKKQTSGGNKEQDFDETEHSSDLSPEELEYLKEIEQYLDGLENDINEGEKPPEEKSEGGNWKELKEKNKKARLKHNYPNPVLTKTTIPFSIYEESNAHVKIVLYDIKGREVETLIDGNYQPGKHSIKHDMSKLPSGIYICTISIDGNLEGSINILKIR